MSNLNAAGDTVSQRLISASELPESEPLLRAVLGLINREPEANTFLLGNLLTHGLHRAGIQESYVLLGDSGSGGESAGPGEIRADGVARSAENEDVEVSAVLIRHFGNVQFYFPADDKPVDSALASIAARILDWLDRGKIGRMNGLMRCIDALLPFLGDVDTIKAMTLAVAAGEGDSPGKGTDRYQGGGIAVPDEVTTAESRLPEGFRLLAGAEIGDSHLELMIEEKKKIPEFIVAPDSLKLVINAHRNGGSRSVMLMDGDRLAATAGTAAENGRTAMVVGVFTVDGYRGRGFGTLVTGAIVDEIRRAGMTPVLFYENPDAARIYLRLGFRPIDEFVLLHFKSHV